MSYGRHRELYPGETGDSKLLPRHSGVISMGSFVPVTTHLPFLEFLRWILKTGELANGGKKTQLREQPLRLLLALLKHPGDLVTREELGQGGCGAGPNLRRFRPRT